MALKKSTPLNLSDTSFSAEEATFAATQTKAMPVRTKLVEQLRDAVTDGTFQPGDRLVEREMCERWDVSRNSVREALRQLEAEGLVELAPHRGPSVRGLSYEEMLELKEIHLTLKCLIAKRFAVNGSDADIQLLQLRIDQLEIAMQTRDPHAVKAAKLAYFDAFAAGAKSATLHGYISQVNARLAFLWASSLMVPGRPDENISDLRMLLSMIRNRNPRAAEAAVIIDDDRSQVAGVQGWRSFEARRLTPSKTNNQTNKISRRSKDE